MPVEARLADQDLRPAAELVLQARDLALQLGEIGVGRCRSRLADTRRGPVAAEDVAQRARPLTGGDPRSGGGDRRFHQVALSVRLARRSGELCERLVDGALVALRTPPAERLDLLGLETLVHDEDASLGVRRER